MKILLKQTHTSLFYFSLHDHPSLTGQEKSVTGGFQYDFFSIRSGLKVFKSTSAHAKSPEVLPMAHIVQILNRVA
jgi:hypothetical protein